MSLDEVRRVADAVLYEGYILYPYRASAQKNHSRWQFGVLMPPSYAAVDRSETSALQAECVFEHGGRAGVEVTVRFLQVQRRVLAGPAPDPAIPPVWDEAVAQEVTVATAGRSLLGAATVTRFTVPGGEDIEMMSGARVIRRREPLAGSISVRATPLPGPWQAARLTVRVTNESAGASPGSRDAALPAALVAAHLIITVTGGAFISMTDPPEWARPEVSACQNAGSWPVLAGPEGSRRVMLAAPIILPDHPRIAPESPGELYDGTEIDEILTLRTLALTDEEKAAARATDPRAAALIDRVDAMDAPALERLHASMRGEEIPDSVMVAGHRVARGSQVILRPGSRRADAQDMFLAGRAAVVEAVLVDVDDVAYLAVTLADDPAADLQAAHGRFLYFAPDEVEPR